MKFDTFINSILNEADEAPATVEAPVAPEEGSEAETPVSDEEQLFDKLKELLSKGARFASFIYKSRGEATPQNGLPANGPTRLYNVNLGINYGNDKAANKAVIEAYTPSGNWSTVLTQDEQIKYETEAKEAMLNPKAKENDPYITIGMGIRYNTVTDKLNILGKTQSAEEIAPGVEKPNKVYATVEEAGTFPLNKDGTPRKNSQLAAARRVIDFRLKGKLKPRLNSFDLTPAKIGGLKLNGEIIEFHAEDDKEVPLN